MPPDAPGCEAVRRLVPADKRHGSAQPGSGHCGHVVEIDHAVRFSFPALLARNMRTSNENSHPCRTAELHEGEQGTFGAFRLATWRNVFRSGCCYVALLLTFMPDAAG